MNNETKADVLTFLGTDPGAVKFGNFINYYSFHNVQERTNKLHPHMFPKPSSNKIVCLDIGCNTGDLTQELYNYLKSMFVNHDIYILGIDIDPMLVKRAQESNIINNITIMAGDVMEKKDELQKYLALHEKDSFDNTFCFSVTMWIHLNNGDKGLMEFLSYIKSISRTILLEPQPWHCYRVAQRRLKKSGSMFHHYEGLKIRSNVDAIIENKITEGNFIKIYESPPSSWNRKIYSYHTTNTEG